MNRPEHQIRRASLNDLAQLRIIWQTGQHPVGDLEKRFTEFQVVEMQDGKLIAAIGLQIQGNQARIHSETIGAPEHSEWLRSALWERLQGVARNHGLVRVWIQDANSHWTERGFQDAAGEVLQKLPVNFGEGKWLFLQLREDITPVISLEGELALFRESQKQDALVRERQRRIWNSVAMFIALAIFFVLLFCGFQIFKSYQRGELAGPGGVGMPAPVPVQPPPATSTPPPAKN